MMVSGVSIKPEEALIVFDEIQEYNNDDHSEGSNIFLCSPAPCPQDEGSTGMKKQIRDELSILKNIIIDTVPVKQILLFNSYAYGTAHADSDLDLYSFAVQRRSAGN